MTVVAGADGRRGWGTTSYDYGSGMLLTGLWPV